jgi:para-nitrobenzyl esterase
MASPTARGLFSKAIGESGAFLEQPGAATPPRLRTLAQAEEVGARFGEGLGARTAAQLRAIPAADLLAAAGRAPRGTFWPDIDGLFMKADPHEVFASGGQARVPLIAGSNLDEKSWKDYFGKAPPTLASYRALARSRFPGRDARFLGLYPAGDDAQARRSASDLQSDLFMGYCAWKWADEQRLLRGPAVYRYRFEETLPLRADAPPGTQASAPHAGEIEFVFRVLSSRPLPWRPQDRRVSELMADYWTNFAKTGNPNGPGLPGWPRYAESGGLEVMHLRADPGALPETSLARYAFLAGR